MTNVSGNGMAGSLPMLIQSEKLKAWISEVRYWEPVLPGDEMEGNGKANGNGHNVAEHDRWCFQDFPLDPGTGRAPRGAGGSGRRHCGCFHVGGQTVGLRRNCGRKARLRGRPWVRCPELSMTTVALRRIFSADENYTKDFYRAIGHIQECVR